MSWFSSFMHPGRPYQDAQDQMNKYYNTAQGYLEPYNQGGVTAGTHLQTALEKLMNPGALREEWLKDYSLSDEAKQAQDMATESGMDAASSMGLMGSSPAIQAIQSGTATIGLEDKQRYLKDLMDKYTAGIGLGENIYGVGANTAGQSSTQTINMGDWTGTNTANRTGAGGRTLGGLGGFLGGTVGSFLGPVGSAVGTATGKWLTGG